jgi:hypothetical protein
MEFGLLLDFLNPGCGFEEFRKTVSGKWLLEAPVSHSSHRQAKKACAKRKICVNSASQAAKE